MNQNNKNLIIGIIFGIIIVFFLAWLFTDDVDAPAIQPVATSSLSETFRSNYMSECNRVSGEYSYCSCTYDYLTMNYSMDELLVLEENLDSVITNQILDDALNACTEEL